jgi:hypothetical protein
MTAVAFAATKGHTATIELLHQLGADVNVVARVTSDCLWRGLDSGAPDGMTPVMAAAAGGHTGTVAALHRLGADITAFDKARVPKRLGVQLTSQWRHRAAATC